ncbi:hypothetical protein CW751_06545 [Brumimicrobium salinarum]|uniref:Uncharacterized protein n=1 Tax=Brumimicrobium salinarum TaxID=2058658 RepID=A0A2I0R4B6_9FLAO|nr:EI24 domain-containing protein [Brumimicrobium salinarum]PKR81240.1 hypothetical protein CW751_06545 [Brumimicrobium salinarum]
MKFIQHFILGIKSYWKAIHFIQKHKLYWFLPIPALLMLLIYYVGSQFAHWQSDWSANEGCLVCTNMNETIWFLLKLLLSISIGLILMKFAKYIVVVLLSPMLSVISQIVEKKLTSNTYPFSLQQTMHDVKRGVRIAMRNVMYEYIFFLLILIVSAVGWEEVHHSPFFYLTFAIGFFYYGFSFIDYVNERRRLDIDQSIHFIRRHRGLAIAIGSVYSIFILVPVDLGKMLSFEGFLDNPFTIMGTVLFQFLMWMLASIAPILTIVAATIAMDDLVDLSRNEHALREIDDISDIKQ